MALTPHPIIVRIFFVMLPRRRPAALSVIAVLACIVPLLGMVPSAAGSATTATPRIAAKAKAKAVPGQPPRNRATRPSTVMTYPNRSHREKYAIRTRVINTIKSTWGGRRDRYGAAGTHSGSIRMTTWTFNDMGIAKALAAAHRRGVSVQVLAARTPNRGSKALKYLRKRIHTRFYRAGHPELADRWSFVRTCKSSCRGRGGTPHSKYYLFSNVGSAHLRTITFSTSMNATMFSVTGQWNEATITWDPHVYAGFLKIFKQSRPDRQQRIRGYTSFWSGSIQSLFFPMVGASYSTDPVMRMLNNVHCKGATAGGDSHRRTQIRIIQYAIYDTRGVWIAKKLRQLWNAGCNVKLIFSAMSGPPFKILRAHSGRGPIPMRRSVIRNGVGFIVKYNHNKWMTISGHWGSSTRAFVVMSGSANWGNAAFKGDEQMLIIRNASLTRSHMRSFGKTWRQRSSELPHPGTIIRGKRVIAGKVDRPGETPQKLELGKGDYKYLPAD